MQTAVCQKLTILYKMVRSALKGAVSARSRLHLVSDPIARLRRLGRQIRAFSLDLGARGARKERRLSAAGRSLFYGAGGLQMGLQRGPRLGQAPSQSRKPLDAPARQADLSHGQIGRVMVDPGRRANGAMISACRLASVKAGPERIRTFTWRVVRSISERSLGADAFDTFRLAAQSASIDTRVS